MMQTLSQGVIQKLHPVKSLANAYLYPRDGASNHSDAGTIRFPQAKDTVTRQDETRSEVLVPQ
jgi:hypothetical protein